MPTPTLSNAKCQEALDALTKTRGNITAAAKLLDLNRNTFQGRVEEARRRARKDLPVIFTEFPNWLTQEVRSGFVIVGGDCHYWPGFVSTAHKAFVFLCKELNPKVVILNGDVMDFPGISRHAAIGWENRPKVADEIDAAKDRLLEIEQAAPNAKRFWPLGNHDARFESKLAQVAPEYANVHGVHLKDNFPYWRPCWSLNLNGHTVVKHRYKGGVHATHNNTVASGMNIVTNHDHMLKCVSYSDYRGTRFGISTGTMMDPYGPQAEAYTEQGPLNWQSGLAVLPFVDGALLDPLLVRVIGERKVSFRGEIIRV